MPNVSIEGWFWHVLAPTSAKGFDLTSSQMEITPNLFAPKRLCSCNPGWSLSCKDLDLEWFGSLDLYSSWLSYLLASSWMSICSMLFCTFFCKATFSNLGMVQALNVRCVHRTISRTTLLSTACLVQKGAQHLMVPPHMQVANVKLASSSKRMESWNLIEQKIWPQLDFCHAWCLLVFRWCSILTSALQNCTSALGMSERSCNGLRCLTVVHATLTVPAQLGSC